jgi:secretion/DNA translocation related TadE-like protein
LAVALVGALAALTLLIVPIYAVLAVRQAVTGAADASALAAADVAVGRSPGFPCEMAARVASANGASVTSCTVDGLIVTVTASRSILGISVHARATAGPQPGEAE